MARARNRVHLMPEEREQVDTIIAAAQAEVQTGDTGFIANRALGRLIAANRRGEDWASTAMEYFAEEGLREYLKDEMRRGDTSRIRRSDTGEIVAMSSYVGVHARDDNGIKDNWTQLCWWELLWVTFFEKVDALAKQRDTIDTRVAALRDVAKLRERYPETLTPEEACEMAGIDPRSFGIEGDALTGTDD